MDKTLDGQADHDQRFDFEKDEIYQAGKQPLIYTWSTSFGM